jgi:hypothetical protein
MKTMTRREMVGMLGRGAALGGLGLLAALLGQRATSPVSRETPCSGGGRCGACPALKGCGLPRGMSARLARHDQTGGVR